METIDTLKGSKRINLTRKEEGVCVIADSMQKGWEPNIDEVTLFSEPSRAPVGTGNGDWVPLWTKAATCDRRNMDVRFLLSVFESLQGPCSSSGMYYSGI